MHSMQLCHFRAIPMPTSHAQYKSNPGLDHARLVLYHIGSGVPMELEGVGAVAVGGLLLQVFGQVDDHDCVEGALLHARTDSCEHMPWLCTVPCF